jgi:hypothetical protein
MLGLHLARSLLVPCLLAAPALAQDTLVVDGSGAPDADHASLAAAIQAAQDGDRILVRRGHYGVLEIAGKGLTVIGDEEGPAYVEGIAIHQTDADQPVTVRDFVLTPGEEVLDHAVLVSQCDGPVRLEELSNTFDYVANLRRLKIYRSADVVVSRSILGATTTSGLDAVISWDSSAWIFDSTIARRDNETAVKVLGGSLGLSGVGFPTCSFYCNPGPTLRLQQNAIVELQGSVSNSPPNAIHSGTIVQLPSQARTHQVSTPVYEGGDVSVRLEGVAGDLVMVLFSAPGLATPINKVDVPLLLAAPFMNMNAGSIPASGVVTFSAPIGAVGPDPSILLHTQAFFLNPTTKAWVLSEPTAVMLVDDALAPVDHVYPSTPSWQGSLPNNTAFGAGLGSAGDVNGDGYEDVVVADPAFGIENGIAPYWMRGAACVYHGTSTGLASEPAWCREGTKRLRAYGPSAFGSIVESAGDVDGDGYGDLLVTSITGDQLFVFYGSEAGVQSGVFSLIELSNPWKFQGQAAGVGDVNGDGFDDVLMMAECWSPACTVGGKNRFARVYHGSAAGLVTSAPAWETPAPGTTSATVSSAGDVNGDGYGDLLVGSVPVAQGDDISLFLGGPLVPTYLWSFNSNQLVFSDFLGVGDLNGDGYDDLAFGDGYSKVHVLLGSAAGPSVTPTQTLVTPYYDSSGEIRALGDVDGDGKDDVALESRVADQAWYVFRGTSQGLSKSPSWSVPFSSQGSSNMAGIGDQDGDGKADVIVGEFDRTLSSGPQPPGTFSVYYSLP